MENLRPNKKRAKNAITLIGIVLALQIASLISSYLQYDLLKQIENGPQISVEIASANDTRERIIAIAYLIAYIISAVTFIKWFRRAYYNLHLRADYLSQTEGWAAASWFVPIIALYQPYQIMKELYRETKEILTKNDLINSNQLSTNILGIWWTLWITHNLIGQFVFRYSSNTIHEALTSTAAAFIGDVVGIILAFITIKIIKDYSNAESILKEMEENEAYG